MSIHRLHIEKYNYVEVYNFLYICICKKNLLLITSTRSHGRNLNPNIYTIINQIKFENKSLSDLQHIHS